MNGLIIFYFIGVFLVVGFILDANWGFRVKNIKFLFKCLLYILGSWITIFVKVLQVINNKYD